MMHISYGMIEETYYCDGKGRVSYGVAVYADSALDGSAIVVESFHDITSDREALSELIDTCNELQLAQIHIADVIEDFLT